MKKDDEEPKEKTLVEIFFKILPVNYMSSYDSRHVSHHPSDSAAHLDYFLPFNFPHFPVLKLTYLNIMDGVPCEEKEFAKMCMAWDMTWSPLPPAPWKTIHLGNLKNISAFFTYFSFSLFFFTSIRMPAFCVLHLKTSSPLRSILFYSHFTNGLRRARREIGAARQGRTLIAHEK